ncbi:hypothetical protein IAT40_000480 [Kwoniella sp. CBS 6097]
MTSREDVSATTTLDIPNQSSSTWYLRHLDTHIRASRDHVLGETYGVRYQYQSSFRDTVVPPSNAIWTPEEKSLFFASLRRHSRLRADLISGEVGSKTEIEVEWYLDLLESGASQIGQVDAKLVNGKQRARWDGSRSWREGLAPACREVSKGWIDQEEKLAEGVMRVVDRKDKQDHQEIKRTARRSERRALNKVIPLDPNFTSHQRTKYLNEHPSTIAMFNRWAVEDWGESIDAEKLSTLNRLMRPDWCDWYSERVRIPSPPIPFLNAGGEASDNDNDNETSVSPTKGDPQGKIANDLRNFQYLSSIPKSERSPAQRRDLAAIVNRRRNREKYRLAKLLEEGMTKEEIEKAGGADAVFASRDEGAAGGGSGEYQRRVGMSRAESIEEGSVNQLKKLGMYDYLMLSGMEVFNYEKMARLISQLAPTSSASASPNISFPVLRKIHAELVKYLQRLMYNAIVIAEQAYHQRPAEEEDHEEGEMTSEHVYQALILAGNGHPIEAVNEALERIFRHAEEGSEVHGIDADGNQEEARQSESNPLPNDESGNGDSSNRSDIPLAKPSNLRRPRYATHLVSQSNQPWHLLPSLPPPELDFSTSGNLTAERQVETDSQAELEPEAEIEIDFSALSDAATEQEDNDLDRALELMDKQHDKLCETALKSAATRKRKRSPPDDGEDEEDEQEPGDGVNDGGDVWTSVTVQRINGKTVRPRSKLEQDYLDLLFSVDNARRKRQFVQRRETRYPTTRLRKKAREYKGIKSAAFVIDSDTDEDSDDENTYLPADDEGGLDEDDDDEGGEDDQSDSGSEDRQVDGADMDEDGEVAKEGDDDGDDQSEQDVGSAEEDSD